jgi:hypothetical protein
MSFQQIRCSFCRSTTFGKGLHNTCYNKSKGEGKDYSLDPKTFSCSHCAPSYPWDGVSIHYAYICGCIKCGSTKNHSKTMQYYLYDGNVYCQTHVETMKNKIEEDGEKAELNGVGGDNFIRIHDDNGGVTLVQI